MYIKTFIALLTAQALFTCTISVHADPPLGNADATPDGKALYEREIIRKTGPFKIEDLPTYDSDTLPFLKVADQLPEFGKALRLALHKHWRFGFDKIENCPTELSFIPKNGIKKVSCQFASEGVLDPDWFNDSPDASGNHLYPETDRALNQSDWIYHTLLLGISLRLGKGISTTSMAKVIQVMTRQPPPGPHELQELLLSEGFGAYGTRASQAEPSMRPHGKNEPCQDPPVNQSLLGRSADDALLKSFQAMASHAFEVMNDTTQDQCTRMLNDLTVLTADYGMDALNCKKVRIASPIYTHAQQNGRNIELVYPAHIDACVKACAGNPTSQAICRSAHFSGACQ